MTYLPAPLDIRAVRQEIGLSQTEFADLLSVSFRTVQSCEQGWRKPSASVEKSALLLLMAHRNGRSFGKKPCWKETECPRDMRNGCLAYLSRQGHLCWFMTGTLCKGIRLRSWSDKVAMCMKCDFFNELLCGDLPTASE